MTAVCSQCRQIITGRPPKERLVTVETSVEQLQEACELQEFDCLAQAMAEHMGQFHQQLALEAAAMMHLACKMYLMRYAVSSDARHPRLKQSWQAQILDAMLPGYAAGLAAASAAPESLSSEDS